MVKSILFLVFVCFACYTGYAQGANSPDSFTTSAESNAVSYYYQFIDKQSRLYNGVDHIGYPSKIKGFAYFSTDELQKGTVVYDGLLFKDVPMLYDLLKDQLVILHFNNLMKMSLITPKVKEFSVNGHHFIRIVKDSLHNQPLETGFYDALYSGKSAILVKRTKFVEERVSDRLDQEFIERNTFYIQKDGAFKIVKNYKGLLHLFGDKAREVRRYLKKNKLKYRRDRETTIIKAATYYDTLN